LRKHKASIQSSHDSLISILLVLDERQRAEIRRIHPMRPNKNQRISPSQDPAIEQIISTLQKKATASGHPVPPAMPAPATSSPDLFPPPNRYSILGGIMYMESTPSLALSAAQARLMLDAMMKLRTQAQNEYELHKNLTSLLTPDQIEMIRHKAVSEEAALADLLLRWTEAGK